MPVCLGIGRLVRHKLCRRHLGDLGSVIGLDLLGGLIGRQHIVAV